MKKSTVNRLKCKLKKKKDMVQVLHDEINRIEDRLRKSLFVPCLFCEGEGGHTEGDEYVGYNRYTCSYCNGKGNIHIESEVFSWPAWKVTQKRETPKKWNEIETLRQKKIKELNREKEKK
jgi:hypothetical protein